MQPDKDQLLVITKSEPDNAFWEFVPISQLAAYLEDAKFEIVGVYGLTGVGKIVPLPWITKPLAEESVHRLVIVETPDGTVLSASYQAKEESV